MMRFCRALTLSLLGIGLLAGPSAAQPIQWTGTISTAGADCSVVTSCLVVVDLRTVPSLGVYLDVGTSGTFNFEATIDGVIWFAVPDDVVAATSATADGKFYFSNPGYRSFRIRASAVNGAATLSVIKGLTGLRSTATLTGGGGDGALIDGVSAAIKATVLDLTNTNPLTAAIVDANGTQITSFGGGTQFAEDTASANGDVGTLALARRTDTPATTTGANGDYEALQMSAGRLWVDASGVALTVTLPTGASTGALQSTGNTSLSSIDGKITAVNTGAVVVASSALPTGAATVAKQPALGTAGAAAADVISVQGIASGTNLNVNCASGCSGGTTDTDDASIAGAQSTGLSLALNMGYDGSVWRRVTFGTAGTASAQVTTVQGIASMTPLLVTPSLPTGASTAAKQPALGTAGSASTDVISVQGIASGTALPVSGTITCTNCSGSGVAVNEDVASANADPGTPAYFVRSDTLGSTTGANGDYLPGKTDVNGALWINPFSTTPAAATYLSVRLTDGAAFLTPAVDYTHDAALTVASTVGPVGLARASAAAPTNVSADDDAVLLWALRSGALATQATYAGVLSVAGNGASGTGVQRVTIANDSTGVIGLNAGTAVIGYTSYAATATTTNSATECAIVSAASTNATNCKASAGNFYGVDLVNTTTTTYYLRLYNASGSPTCSSATGFIRSIPIPPAGAAGQAGGIVRITDVPVGYSTGIAFCLTGGSASTDNTNAATGVFGAILFK